MDTNGCVTHIMAAGTMSRHYTYQLTVLAVLGPVMIVAGAVAGDLRVVGAGVAFAVLGLLGYLHGRKDG
jgi:hypothetical protein